MASTRRLQERQEFATSACDYVDTKLLEQSALLSKNQTMVVILSFSFVNTDLRDIFRSRFPNAGWALVDTTQSDADDRIKSREGHFYKGAPPEGDEKKTLLSKKGSLEDNSEWNFAPVTFPHIVLDGNEPIAANAQRVVDVIRKEFHA